MISRRVLALAFVFAFAIATGIGLTLSRPTAQTLQTVRIGITPFQDTVLPVIPQKLGWYEQDGFRAEFVDVGWSDVPLGLASGSFDVVLYTFDSVQPSWPALQAGGKDMIFYAPLYVFNGAAIMVHGNAGYQTLPSLQGLTQAEVEQRTKEIIGQLRGKKIGITEGTTAEQVVREALAKGGLTDKDVQLIHARYEDNLAAFLAGRLDAFVGGVTERIKARQAGAVELITGSAVSVPVIDGWVTTKSFAEKNPKIMQSLVDNFFRTVRYMDEDVRGRANLATDYLKGKASVDYTPDEYAYSLTFQYFPKTREEAIKTFLDLNSPYYWRRIWEYNNNFFIKTGKITQPVPFGVFWGESALRGQ